MHTLRTYRGRFWLLCLVAVLLVGTLWKKRLSSSVGRWRSHQDLSARLSDDASANERLAAMRAEVQGLHASLGDLTSPADLVWQAVLTQIGKGSALDDMRLHRLEAEMLSEQDGTELRVLPVTLRGSFPALLRTANDLQRAVPEAHVISIRFHTERAPYNRPRELLMTLYLQKIVRHV